MAPRIVARFDRRSTTRTARPTNPSALETSSICCAPNAATPRAICNCYRSRAVTNGGAKSWSRGQSRPPAGSLKRRRVYRCFRFRCRSWSEALPSPSSHRYSTSATCPYCVSARVDRMSFPLMDLRLIWALRPKRKERGDTQYIILGCNSKLDVSVARTRPRSTDLLSFG